MQRRKGADMDTRGILKARSFVVRWHTLV